MRQIFLFFADKLVKAIITDIVTQIFCVFPFSSRFIGHFGAESQLVASEYALCASGDVLIGLDPAYSGFGKLTMLKLAQCYLFLMSFHSKKHTKSIRFVIFDRPIEDYISLSRIFILQTISINPKKFLNLVKWFFTVNKMSWLAKKEPNCVDIFLEPGW